MTTTTAPAALANGIAALEFSRRILDRMLEDFPADKWTAQPWSGANHALWIVGHAAVSDDYFLQTLGGRPRQCPEGWSVLFGMGSEPKDDDDAYPSPDEVRATAGEARAALLAWFRDMDGTKLAEPVPDDLRGFAPTHGALMSTMAAHDAIHIGQLSSVRRALGMSRILG